MLRQPVYSRLAGYEDANDAERLSQDPTFRRIGSEKIWERGAALTSRLQSFETELLVAEENVAGVAAINRKLIARVEAVDAPQRIVLDMDATALPIYGRQEQGADNGHFESTCHHPLLLFNREGDCLAARLRPGNVHSAEGWEEVLLPQIERQQRMETEFVFRADAAFSKLEIYEALEARGVKYAIRLPAHGGILSGAGRPKWKSRRSAQRGEAGEQSTRPRPGHGLSEGLLRQSSLMAKPARPAPDGGQGAAACTPDDLLPRRTNP